MSDQVEIFGDRPSGKPTKLTLAEGGAPLRPAEKASLIDEYIHRFLLVTRHRRPYGTEASVSRICGDFSGTQPHCFEKWIERFAVSSNQRFAYAEGKNSPT